MLLSLVSSIKIFIKISFDASLLLSLKTASLHYSFVLMNFCNQLTIFFLILLLKKLKYLKSLKSFHIAYSKDNKILIIYFLYFIPYAIGFKNLFKNIIELIIYIFFIKSPKLSNCYRLWNSKLLYKLFNPLFNILLYWALNFFCFLNLVNLF